MPWLDVLRRLRRAPASVRYGGAAAVVLAALGAGLASVVRRLEDERHRLLARERAARAEAESARPRRDLHRGAAVRGMRSAREPVLMIVGAADAIDVDAYVLTGAIDGTTVRGEDLVEARHRAHGLRILVTMEVLFRDWPRNGRFGAA